MVRFKVTAIVASIALFGTAPVLMAQEVVRAAPSATLAVSADSFASDALAQVDDQADAGYAKAKVARYIELLEVNGSKSSLKKQIETLKESTRQVIIKSLGRAYMTAEENTKFELICSKILSETESRILNEIAVNQSKTFTLEEISALISANSSPLAAKFVAGKSKTSPTEQHYVQTYVVEAVVYIIKTFRETKTS